MDNVVQEHKTLAINIVKGNSNNNSIVTYDPHSFMRELQIKEGNKIVHKSGLHHPESNILTTYKSIQYLCQRSSKDIYVLRSSI